MKFYHYLFIKLKTVLLHKKNVNLVIIFFLFSLNYAFSQDLPPIKLDYASYALSSGGKLIGYYGEKNRVEVKNLDDISVYVIHSLIATEDRDFYEHHGVSLKGLGRAILKTITGSTQGGSTITMQLARNLFLSNERTISRKLTEIELAEKLEKKFTKKEILLLYLNTVYFGHGAYGIWAASEEYFSKTPDKLSIDESAALVGMLQSPNGYDPDKNPKKMLNRRNEVLHNLVEVGKLSKKDYNTLKNKGLNLKLHQNIAGHFLEQVRLAAIDILKSTGKILTIDQLKITTTLNYDLQKAAEDAVASQWEKFPDRMKNTQIGLISIECGTGLIRAMVGGNPSSEPRGLNHATQIQRQPGSSFKPFLYGSLLENGYTLATPLLDSSIVVDSGKAFEWRPSNSDNETSNSYLTMQYSIAHSVNLAAAYAITHLSSPDSVISFARKCGIKSSIPSLPSIALGTAEVRPIEMASAFSVFASEGTYAKPFSILKISDKDGNVLYSANPSPETVLDSATSFLITTALEKVVNEGTAVSVRNYFKGTAAGKTGTTQNYTDAWFVGYNPKLSTAIWIGFDDPQKKLSGGFQYGGTACAPIWGKMMADYAKTYASFANQKFSIPSNIEYKELCEDTGELADSSCTRINYYAVNMDLLNLEIQKERYDIHYGF